MTALLLEFAVRTALIAAGTAAVLWALRIKAASVRHAAWAAVVVTMLVLPLLLAGRVRMSLPVLTPAPVAASGAISSPTPQATTPVERAPTVAPLGVGQDVALGSPAPQTMSMDWRLLLLGTYLAGTVILLLRLGIGTVQANRLRRGAVVRDGRLTSDVCTTPITVGWIEPTLILPSGWDRWSREQLAVVLTHEREHARRHDPLTQWLALLNRAVFWFHPLAWWLERRLATLAEEACDAAVLTAGHSPQDYSEYLLDMARTVSRQHGRVRLVGMAMPGTGLPDRLRFILQGLPNVRVSRARLVCTVAFCAISSAIFAAGTLAERALQQKPAASPITFDVVSIKPCPGLDVVRPPGSGRGANPGAPQISPGFLHWDCVTLSGLIDQAYTGGDLRLLNVLARARDDGPKRVRGGPSWINSELFTIEVKLSGDVTELTRSARFIHVRDAMLPALRAMIEDRFKLKLHRATEQQSMYGLSVAKDGLSKDKVTKIAPGDCWAWDPSTNRTTPPQGLSTKQMCGNVHGGLHNGNRTFEYAGGDTMTGFAQELSTIVDRYVLDKTGLEGMFKFAFEYAPDESTPGNREQTDRVLRSWAAEGVPQAQVQQLLHPDGPTIFKALEALGLKLELTKGPAEYLVIDSAERPKPNAAFAIDPPARAPSPSGPNADPVQDPRAPAVQTPAPKFDVVSIKPCPDVSTAQTGRGAGPNLAQTSPGHVFWACVTLAALVDQAYAGWDFPLLNTQGEPLSFEPMRGEARDNQKRVRGGPSWMYSERFTIEATGSVDVIKPPAGAVNLMRLPVPMNRALRAMLEDRFQLKLRRETEERPMYALTVAQGGLKAKPRAPSDCDVAPDVRPPGTQGRPTFDGFFQGKWFCGSFSTAPLGMQGRLFAGEDIETVRSSSPLDRRYEYRGVTMQVVADQLARAMDRFVLDKTRVAGEFLLAVEFKSDERTPGGGFFLTKTQPDYGGTRRPETPTGSGTTIFQAFEALGLRIEPTKGPAEYLRIESAQRPRADLPASAGSR